jgi:hypothetical protein
MKGSVELNENHASCIEFLSTCIKKYNYLENTVNSGC